MIMFVVTHQYVSTVLVYLSLVQTVTMYLLSWLVAGWHISVTLLLLFISQAFTLYISNKIFVGKVHDDHKQATL